LYIFYRFLWISWLFLHIEDLKYLKIEWNWLISSKLARSSNSIPVKWTKKMNTQSDGIKIKRGH
jgi:hypothetical protein